MHLDKGIGPDERVVFYPSIGVDRGSHCRIEVRGRVFEEHALLKPFTEFSLLSGIHDLKDMLRLLGPSESKDRAEKLFEERARYFLKDSERNESLEIAIRGKTITVGKSDESGFFGVPKPDAGRSGFLSSAITLPAEDLRLELQGGNSFWVEYDVKTDDKSFRGRSRVIGKKGAIIVSDIDDTIKETNVPNEAEVILNTFFRPFRHTPGMPEIYRAWEKKNASFIYLSNSPYELYEPLSNYLQGAGHYPHGAYYMCRLDEVAMNAIVKLMRIDKLHGPHGSPKKRSLIPILQAFPDRNFILIGDSTEHDADIYVDLYEGVDFPAGFPVPADGFKKQIKKIYIRNVQNSDNANREAAQEAIDRANRIEKGVARFFDAQNPVQVLQEAVDFL